MRPVTDATTHWRFATLSGPVTLMGCPDLIDEIKASLNGWPIAPWPPAGPRPASVITIARRGEDHVLTSDAIDGEESYPGVPFIVCAFMAELITAYGRTRPDRLFLHAGAAVVEDRLVVFPARGKTGKSTLTAQVASRGGRVFSDDVLPVALDSLNGMALGIEPRLRLPLPVDVAPPLRGWVDVHKRLTNRKMTYLGLPRRGAGSLAPFGEERPIDAFILLVREAGTRAVLEPCKRSDIMKLLIRQHFGAHAPAANVVERFKVLVENVPCYRLAYGGGEEAPELLLKMAQAA